jgi:adenylosuccinate synthase
MSIIVLVGGQWGDEGKGKVVDLLAPRFDIVARFAGGPNAGHTVRRGDVKYALRHIPSGAVTQGITCMIGNGVVIEPVSLLKEIDDLVARGLTLKGRLWISHRVHVILPAYIAWETRREEAGTSRIGTTRRGVGPVYAAKMARTGVRLIDLYDRDGLEERLREALALFADGGAGALAATGSAADGEVKSAVEACLAHAEALRPYLADTAGMLSERVASGASVLFEGAQGSMLDIDHGTYPYVTSSTASAGGACSGFGVGPTSIDGVLGIFKAYATRVGEGPFPTEERGAVGETIRERGHEYGTVTGRPRRCGWFDAVAARYAARLNGMDSAALTLLDVLDAFDEVKICVGYRHQGEVLERFPSEPWIVSHCEPVYRTLKGWKTPTTQCRTFDDLPGAASDYVRTIEDLIECDIDLVSVGPGPEASLTREVSKLAAWLEPAARR